MNRDAHLMPIYLVSLRTDDDRRERLRTQFGRAWEWVTVVDAIDSRKLSKGAVARQVCCRRKSLGPREIAVAMSHMEVWKRFITSGARTCLVFEDDVLGDIGSVVGALSAMQTLPDGAFMLLGGQEGLRNRRYVYGRKLQRGGVPCWSLPRPSWRFTSRACSYGLTRSAARDLLLCQQMCLSRADHWHRLFRAVDDVYMTNLFAHPLDLSNSHIEAERRTKTNRPRWYRIAADGLIYTLATAAIKVTWPLVAKCRGFQRIPCRD